MKQSFCILILLLSGFFCSAQENSVPDFEWGNSAYFNLNVDESIVYNDVEIKLLGFRDQFNKIKIGRDTLTLKVSQRSLPVGTEGVRVFVADNKHVKVIADNKSVHGLLTKDALLCVSKLIENMLDTRRFIFPVSYNDGFLWSAEEDAHMFAHMGKTKADDGRFYCRAYEGIGIDLSDARGIEKHWIVAMENSTVVWIEDKNVDRQGKTACVLLESQSSPGIYYLYNHLYKKNVEVRPGQKLVRGELLGTSWGNEKWGHLQLVVIQSDTVPDYNSRFTNSVNIFPQLYELYFQNAFSRKKYFSKGRIVFGKPEHMNRNQKNTLAFEDYSGRGWNFGKWNKVDKVEWIDNGRDGNVRLRKVLHANTKAQSRNPKNYYDYEVSVRNGVYRIRAKVGDLNQESWQKVEFEGVGAGTYSCNSGEYKWTTERVVRVSDYKLTIRIYFDKENKKVAGLSEIVFQQAY